MLGNVMEKQMIQKLRQELWKWRYNERPYHPHALWSPPQLLDVTSAWKGNELIIRDILDFTGIKRGVCLEFGVDNAFSTVAFSNFFQRVVGVDIFTGDIHSGLHTDNYSAIQKITQPFPNIELIKSDYRDFIATNNDCRYDLIHVDIVHSYEDTYRCGLWAAAHSDCVLFHDTVSFREVIRAVTDISRQTHKKFYHYREKHGLGILCNK